MLVRYEHGDVVWVDLEAPTRAEVRSVMEEFSLDALVAEELLLPTAKPRAEFHERFIYLILHFPALRHTHRSKEQEVDFIVGEKFIITTRYDTIDPLHKFSKVFEVHSVLDRSNLGNHAGFIFFYMMKKLYGAVEHELSFVSDALDTIEEEIYEGKEREMVEALSKAGRDLLNLRQAIEPHRDVLKEFEPFAKALFGAPFAPYVKSIVEEYYRVHNHTMRKIESLRELRETNTALLYTKQNDIIRVLTIMTFVTSPLMLFAGIFGMNAVRMPIVEHPQGFWILCGVMLASAAGMFLYFRHKRWL